MAEDFQRFMRDEIRNQEGVTESVFPNAANPSPGAYTGKDNTLSQTLYPNIDPILFLQSNGDSPSPGGNVAPRLAHQRISRRQPPRHHALTHPRGAHRRYIPLAANPSTSSPPPESPTWSEERPSNAQTVRSRPQNRRSRGLNSDTGAQADNTQGQPPRKKQRKSSAQRNTATFGTVRRTNGNLEWFDNEDLRWKPAGRHCDYRADLLALAAQQPGAPLWTEDMGTDYTSFSPLTQRWNEDPNSVVDAKGRRVFSMEQRPADWIRNPKYRHLIYNGLVMLDHNDNPVRDIPGLPLTLESQAPAWLLGGLKRCVDMTIPDFLARSPATWESSTGAKEIKSLSCLPQRIKRWLESKEIKMWDKRQKARKIEQPTAAKLDHQGSVAARSGYLPTAGPELGLNDLNSSDLFSQDPYLSPETLYELDSTYHTAQSRAESYNFDDEGSPLSSRETSALAEHVGHADTVHLQIPQSSNSNPGLQQAPAYNDGYIESENSGERNLYGGSGFGNEDPARSPNNHIGMPAPWSQLESTHAANYDSNILDMSSDSGQQSIASPYYLGNQSNFVQPTSVLLSRMAYSPNVAAESTMRYVENSKQPQSYGGQEQPHNVSAETNNFFDQPNINVDTQDDLFSGADFRYTPPRTTAEIAFIQSILSYTRAHYKSLTLQEPPESSYLASYAEQYSEIQEELEKSWPPELPPVKLRAIGPVFGGLNNC